MAEQQFTTEELENEEWRNVVGYEGIYSVSNLGRIRRDLSRTYGKAGHILKWWADPTHKRASNRRPTVTLCKDNHKETWQVHMIVALAFLGPYPEGHEVNHIDGELTNTRASNFEYLTTKANHEHAARMGLKAHGTEHHAAKLTDEDVREIRQRYARGDISQRALARAYPVNQAAVKDILLGITWTHVV